MIVAVLLAAATWLLFADDSTSRHRVRALTARERSSTPFVNPTTTRIACVLAGLALALLVPGVLGWVGGAVTAIAGPFGLAKLGSREQHARADELSRQAPVIAELLSACVASGATLRDATAVVAQAVDGPGAHVLEKVVAAIDLGASAESAWAEAARLPGIAPIARAVIRSSHSGAPLAQVLAQLADDVRRERRVTIEVAARAAGVKAVAPLAVCFLPAFLLLSVVPIVVDLGTSMLNSQG